MADVTPEHGGGSPSHAAGGEHAGHSHGGVSCDGDHSHGSGGGGHGHSHGGGGGGHSHGDASNSLFGGVQPPQEETDLRKLQANYLLMKLRENTSTQAPGWRTISPYISELFQTKAVGKETKLEMIQPNDIFTAVIFGTSQMVQDLLRSGISPNAFDRWGFTPLHYACRRPNIDMVHMLVDGPSAWDDTVNSDEAIKRKQDEEIEAVAGNLKAGKKELQTRILKGTWADKQMQEYERASSSSSKATNNDYESALVDAFSENEKKNTPLMMAADGGDVYVMDFLLRRGADLDAIDGAGQTALHRSVVRNKFLSVVYLCHRGADVNKADGDGATALHWAAYHGQHKTCRYLIHHQEANTTLKDKHGFLPLHWAAARGHFAASQACIQSVSETVRKIQLTAKANNGMTAAEMADGTNNKETSEPLKLQTTLASLTGLSSWMAHPWFLCALCVFLSINVFFGCFYFLSGGYATLAFMTWMIVFTKFVGYDAMMQNHEFVVQMVFTIGWMYCGATYLLLAFPVTVYMEPVFTWIFWVVGLMVPVFYYRLNQREPGTVPGNASDMMYLLFAVENGIEPKSFCTTCCLRRPYRSKHCPQCDKCFARFDHHCPWLGTCVAYNNTNMFFGFITYFLVAQLWWMRYLMLTFRASDPQFTDVSGFWHTLGVMSHESPWFWVVCLFNVINTCWVVLLWFEHFVQVATNLTTNELYNFQKYKYLKNAKTGKFSNSNNKGVVSNLNEVFLEKDGPKLQYADISDSVDTKPKLQQAQILAVV
eukprot:TRINITY_DN3836_c0_g1_i1.p1 TRINITY_DN3836_c0_g1~~TRINITY_DN3836_c0_g1_i1.p1  ORF type:complete len:767 (-),score=134.90 TRINITY_DN3836_c0_g1_i1:76-2376(-)